MTDINFLDPSATAPNGGAGNGQNASDNAPDAVSEGDLIALIELFFFAYRDFTSDPDALLQKDGFGRAHHRVLHFVARNPGLRVADLLDILKITKQSLGRVLRELVERGYIEQRTGEADRRERRLFATEAGHTMAAELRAPQLSRINAALGTLNAGDARTIRAFLLAMVNTEEHAKLRDLVLERTTGETGGAMRE